MSLYSISEQQAEKVAREFLQQQYSMIMVVEVLASLYDDKRKINVKVNARTGSILGWQ